MACLPRCLDVSAPLSPGLACLPWHPAEGVVINEGLTPTAAEPGRRELDGLPLRMAGAGDAPARVVLER